MKYQRQLGPSQPRPPAPPCLERRRSSSSKGGTLIVVEVQTVAEHERRLAELRAYQPPSCPTCDASPMRAHDFRERRPRNAPGLPSSVWIRRFICAAASCRAVWRVLPGFLARCLWHPWSTVTASLTTGRKASVPLRTRRRWRSRLSSCGRSLARLLTTASEALGKLGAMLPPEPSRRDVIDAYGGMGEISGLAALVHRLSGGLRVM